MENNYYKILGVRSDASLADIKQAFRKLAKIYHPDINKDPNSSDIFKLIYESYSILSDERLRSIYDKKNLGAEIKRSEQDEFEKEVRFRSKEYESVIKFSYKKFIEYLDTGKKVVFEIGEFLGLIAFLIGLLLGTFFTVRDFVGSLTAPDVTFGFGFIFSIIWIFFEFLLIFGIVGPTEKVAALL